VNYQFETLGGGIVASDPRFAGWLQSSTAGTLGQGSSTADGPLPLWSSVLLALLLLGCYGDSRKLNPLRGWRLRNPRAVRNFDE
jgi:hypothetical protein